MSVLNIKYLKLALSTKKICWNILTLLDPSGEMVIWYEVMASFGKKGEMGIELHFQDICNIFLLSACSSLQTRFPILTFS